MLTLERKRPGGRTMEKRFAKITREELDLLPETDYTVSDATVAEWDELVRETQEQLHSGKIIPKTAAEMAAMWGLGRKRVLGTLEGKMSVSFASDFSMTDEEFVGL